MSEISCPKCGSDNVQVQYCHGEDVLECRCLRCSYSFDKEPLDRCHPFLGGPDPKKEAQVG